MLAVGAMFLIGSLEVVSRNFFSKSFIWSQELIVVFLVWEVFLAAAYIYSTGTLISVVAVWYGWQFQAVQAKFLTNALRLPQNIHSIPLVICGVSMLLRLLQKYLAKLFEKGGGDAV